MAGEATTERADYTFRVKEYGQGEPWIMAEPYEGNIPLLENGFIGFDLREGVSFEDAHKLAEMMRNMIVGMSFTDLTNVR